MGILQKSNEIKELKSTYEKIKREIERRLEDFKKTWRDGDNAIFAELIFCLLTPQSKAKVCWNAVLKLLKKNLLLKGDEKKIAEEIKGVRFRNKKVGYIMEARKLIYAKENIKEKLSKFRNAYEAREWLVKNIKGMGYKEASHFLRNIGQGFELAILDRHILKNLKLLEVIDEIPPNLSRKKYLEIEEKMREFSVAIDIPMPHLDLLLWYKEAGEVFK